MTQSDEVDAPSRRAFSLTGKLFACGDVLHGSNTTCATHKALVERREHARPDAVMPFTVHDRPDLQGDLYAPYRLEDHGPRFCVHAGPRATREGATGSVSTTARPWHPDGGGHTRRGGRGARTRQERARGTPGARGHADPA